MIYREFKKKKQKKNIPSVLK